MSSHADVSPLSRFRSLAAGVVGLASMTLASGQASASTIDLSTANNAASWLITGAGANNATFALFGVGLVACGIAGRRRLMQHA